MAQGIFDRVRGELAAREKSPGLTMSDLLTLREPQSGLLTWMVRQEVVAFGDVIAFLGGDEAQARLVLADLLDKLCEFRMIMIFKLVPYALYEFLPEIVAYHFCFRQPSEIICHAVRP